jgi:hypothetical protein
LAPLFKNRNLRRISRKGREQVAREKLREHDQIRAATLIQPVSGFP